MNNEAKNNLNLRQELGAVPKRLWLAIPVVMAAAAVLPGGLAGCPHGARWIFGFPFPNMHLCGTIAKGMLLWHPAAIAFNMTFWFVFLSAVAVLSPKVAQKYNVGDGLFFAGAVLALTALYFVYYRGYVMLFATWAF